METLCILQFGMSMVVERDVVLAVLVNVMVAETVVILKSWGSSGWMATIHMVMVAVFGRTIAVGMEMVMSSRTISIRRERTINQNVMWRYPSSVVVGVNLQCLFHSVYPMFINTQCLSHRAIFIVNRL